MIELCSTNKLIFCNNKLQYGIQDHKILWYVPVTPIKIVFYISGYRGVSIRTMDICKCRVCRYLLTFSESVKPLSSVQFLMNIWCVLDLQGAFCTMDTSGEGKLGRMDILTLLASDRFLLSQEEIRQLAAQMEMDEDGSIDFNEWLAVMADWREVWLDPILQCIVHRLCFKQYAMHCEKLFYIHNRKRLLMFPWKTLICFPWMLADVCQVQKSPQWKGWVMEAFSWFDMNENGWLGSEELTKVLCGNVCEVRLNKVQWAPKLLCTRQALCSPHVNICIIAKSSWLKTLKQYMIGN